jgi:hypothetical protein
MAEAEAYLANNENAISALSATLIPPPLTNSQDHSIETRANIRLQCFGSVMSVDAHN